MYHRSPFDVIMDSSHVQLLNVPIHVKPLGSNKAKITIKTDNSLLHTFIDQKTMNIQAL